MAGFFGLFDYTKPGKGVEKDEPPKPPFFQFWALVWRRLSRLMVHNLMYFLCISPIVAVAYMAYYLPYISEYPDAGMSFLATILINLAAVIPYPVGIALLAASCIFYGPLTCGLAYIFRNYVRGEHSWYTDLFVQAKANFKQGVFFGLLEVAAVAVYYFNAFVAPERLTGNSAMVFISTVLSFFVLVLLVLMRSYYFPMVVTFELSIRNILKNSLMLGIVGLFRNLLTILTVIVTGFIVVIFFPSFTIGSVLELVFMAGFMFSFWGFTSTFLSYPLIKKHMLDPIEKQNEEPSPEVEDEEK